MNMIEKVVNAMEAELKRRGHYTKETKLWIGHVAGKAIEAMREPTEEMLAVKHMSISYDSKELINMFIDAALKDK